MLWKYSNAKQLWTCGAYAIELSSAGYELYSGETFVHNFPDLRSAKQYARGMAYQSGELVGRSRGRPKSPDSCTECGAPPSHQQRG